MSLWLVSLALQGVSLAAVPDLYAPDWEWESNRPDGLAGWEMAALGDVDGDGYDDFAAVTDYTLGMVGVFHGTADGPESFPRIEIDGGYDGSFPYEGINLAGGDFDGDGYGDLAIADAFDGTNTQGIARIWFGTPLGLFPYVGWSWAPPGTDHAAAGYGLAAADVNGDGYDDLIAGAPGYDDGQNNEGAFLLFLGSPVGPGSVPSMVEGGDVTDGGFGAVVGSIGDVNGDGFGDIAVVSYNISNGSADEGRVTVYHGRATGLRAIPSKVWEPDQDAIPLGYWGNHLLGGGYFYGDGYSDLLVGVWGWSNGAYREGRVVAFTGSAAGLSLHPTWEIEGNQDDSDLGWEVAAVGDIDSDGYDDALLGAAGYDAEAADVGRVELYRGGADGLEDEPSAFAFGDTHLAGIGQTTLGAGDVNGDGWDDMVAAAPGGTDGEESEGTLLAWFGSGPTEVGEDLYGGPGDLEGANLDGEPQGLGCNAVPGVSGLAWLVGLLFLRRRR